MKINVYYLDSVWLNSVSYTHLDVYKRQVIESFRTQKTYMKSCHRPGVPREASNKPTKNFRFCNNVVRFSRDYKHLNYVK